ncbi:MAG: hypothetical protein LBF04_01225 [Prevotellaceae bacterium]|nr:hypothetical protein [Prevotellaceae bacterium]
MNTKVKSCIIFDCTAVNKPYNKHTVKINIKTSALTCQPFSGHSSAQKDYWAIS